MNIKSPVHQATNGSRGRCDTCGEVMPCQTRLADGPFGTMTSSSCCTLFGLAQDSYKRTSGAATERTWGELDALGAIVLAAAAAEAFINELAEWSRQASAEPRDFHPIPPEVNALADAVLAVEAPHNGPRDTSTKFKAALQALSGKPHKEDAHYQQFRILMRARDGIVHTKLDVQPAPSGSMSSCLPAVVKKLARQKITGADPVVPPAAVDQLSTPGVACWACNSAAAMVQAVIVAMPPGGNGLGEFRERLSLDHSARCFTFLPSATRVTRSERVPTAQRIENEFPALREGGSYQRQVELDDRGMFPGTLAP